MPHYTFIVDYAGGTYISQIVSPDVDAAVFAWAAALEIEAIPKLKAKHKKKLERALREKHEDGMDPVRISTLTNVWCQTVLVRHKLMLVNIVQTDTWPLRQAADDDRELP